MAEISAKIVMELRGRTGAGMMDCKKALAAVDGDMEKAIDYLREKGLAAAAKKQSRIAAEGLVGSFVCKECATGALVEVNCETDFVAKTDKFKALVADVAEHVAKKNPADVDELLKQPFFKDEATTIEQMVTAATAEIGEKISIRRFVRYEGGIVESYIHMGGKVGVLVQAEGEPNEEVIHDVALQIAAASPVAPEYVRREEVDPSHLEHEKEILIAQARNEGKPENIIEKMVQGRIVKFYKEVCLLEQAFVKDADISVGKMIEQKAKGLNIVRFTRYKMGDGLEKKVNDRRSRRADWLDAEVNLHIRGNAAAFPFFQARRTIGEERMYKRIILKLSGEALAPETLEKGKIPTFDALRVEEVARVIAELSNMGVQVGVIMGGGNIWRGRFSEEMNAVSADQMGMLATIINALVVEDALCRMGKKATVFTAQEMNRFARLYTAKAAIECLENGEIVLLAGGTGNPFFTTDTGAALRAAELKADAVFKGTTVEGVYDSDPRKNPDAKLIRDISYREAVTRGLRVMDLTAFMLCMEQKVPVVRVFSMENLGNILRVAAGEELGTTIHE